jgi:hypothetical protein
MIKPDNYWTYSTNPLAESITFTIPYLSTKFNLKVMNTTNFDKYKVGIPTYQKIKNAVGVQNLLEPVVIKNDKAESFYIIIEHAYENFLLGGQIKITETFQLASATSKLFEIVLGVLFTVPGIAALTIVVILSLLFTIALYTYVKRRNAQAGGEEIKSLVHNQINSDDEDENLEEPRELTDLIDAEDDELKTSLMEIAKNDNIHSQ